MRARIFTRWLPFLSLLAVCFSAAASNASAHHPSVTEFQAGLSPNNGAWDIVSGDDGKLWFTEDGLSAFGPLTPATDSSASSPACSLGRRPVGIATGPDGNVWFAE